MPPSRGALPAGPRPEPPGTAGGSQGGAGDRRTLAQRCRGDEEDPSEPHQLPGTWSVSTRPPGGSSITAIPRRACDGRRRSSRRSPGTGRPAGSWPIITRRRAIRGSRISTDRKRRAPSPRPIARGTTENQFARELARLESFIYDATSDGKTRIRDRAEGSPPASTHRREFARPG